MDKIIEIINVVFTRTTKYLRVAEEKAIKELIAANRLNVSDNQTLIETVKTLKSDIKILIGSNDKLIEASNNRLDIIEANAVKLKEHGIANDELAEANKILAGKLLQSKLSLSKRNDEYTELVQANMNLKEDNNKLEKRLLDSDKTIVKLTKELSMRTSANIEQDNEYAIVQSINMIRLYVIIGLSILLAVAAYAIFFPPMDV